MFIAAFYRFCLVRLKYRDAISSSMKIEVDFNRISHDDVRKLIRMLQAYLGEHPASVKAHEPADDVPLPNLSMFDQPAAVKQEKEDYKIQFID